jgi:hypothetical protein
MLEQVLRVIVAYKKRVAMKFKKRSPIDRLKARQRYKRKKAIYKVQRRRYLQRNKVFLKSRKTTKRAIPHPKKHTAPKPHFKKPKKPTVKKFHVPKRAKRP